ncbi:MAG: 50S ribosomal protein L16 [Planctomycetes bacterium]|nr:50S ribosomal protein L16 [Planctomycetota bacterium]MCB9825838.1 50S ribosomal protein L16 [Planctomycetota bacterium]MCB9829123.1 50S ribosomal protein L16 [Planctomycetota bacterium]MCB9901237.1 50S ribosomal protein L16 [Planctomycetota bacterium]
MLMPKRVKWRKMQRGKIAGAASRGATVAFGDYGLQCLQAGWIPANVIEAGRVAAVRAASDGRVYIRIFPQKSVTSTPEETRMGTGKGEPDYWAAVVRPGTMLFEIGGGVSEAVAKRALNKVAHKLPVRCRFVSRRSQS